MQIQKPTAVFARDLWFPWNRDTGSGKATCKDQELITRMPEVRISWIPYQQHGHLLDFF